eukprot:2503995-Amphidinium_carterae.2
MKVFKEERYEKLWTGLWSKKYFQLLFKLVCFHFELNGTGSSGKPLGEFTIMGEESTSATHHTTSTCASRMILQELGDVEHIIANNHPAVIFLAVLCHLVGRSEELSCKQNDLALQCNIAL